MKRLIRALLVLATVFGIGTFIRRMIQRAKKKSGLGLVNEIGGFHWRPNIIFSDGELTKGSLPQELKCDQTVYIYVAHTVYVRNCDGYEGPDDYDNSLLQECEKVARQAAAQIICPSDCPPQISEVFRGWSCFPKDRLADAVIEFKVECRTTN